MMVVEDIEHTISFQLVGDTSGAGFGEAKRVPLVPGLYVVRAFGGPVAVKQSPADLNPDDVVIVESAPALVKMTRGMVVVCSRSSADISVWLTPAEVPR